MLDTNSRNIHLEKKNHNLKSLLCRMLRTTFYIIIMGLVINALIQEVLWRL